MLEEKKQTIESDAEEGSVFDRRIHSRITVEIPVNVRSLLKEISGLIMDVTTQGAAIKIQGNVLKVADSLELSFIPNGHNSRVIAKGVVCSVKLSDAECLIGIRFVDMALDSRAVLSSWLGERLKRTTSIGDRRTKSEIISQRLEFYNRKGKKIVGVCDFRKGVASDAPWVIIPPAYGETKTSVITTSFYLALNGFRCLRYDATNHTGESDGDIMHWSCRSMADDLQSTIDYLQAQYGIARSTVVAYSMAARAAAKAAAEDSRISNLVTLVGVVDLQATLRKAYKEDLIETYIQGKRWGITEVVGFQVDLASIEATIAGLFHTLQTTIEDLKQSKARVIQIVTENDLWVDIEDAKKVATAINSEMIVIKGAFHQLSENPSIAKTAMRMVVEKCLQLDSSPAQPVGLIHEPTLREIALQSRLEKEILRNLNTAFKENEVEFWEKYLSSFDFILRSHDYQDLYEVALKWLPARNKYKFLDAGCGVGNFIVWFLEKSSQKNIHGDSAFAITPARIEYVGIDFVEAALVKARQRVEKIDRETSSSNRLGQWSFVHENLNKTLNIPNNYFDFCSGNLVLSYVDDPLFTLREFYRISNPGGRVVVTSLKHNPDLGVIFNEFAKDAKDDDLDKARELLNNAGGIRHRVSEGYFRFFSANELERLMQYAGFVNVSSLPVILNQGVMVVGEKR